MAIRHQHLGKRLSLSKGRCCIQLFVEYIINVTVKARVREAKSEGTKVVDVDGSHLNKK
jgi:hypothetical protein